MYSLMSSDIFIPSSEVILLDVMQTHKHISLHACARKTRVKKLYDHHYGFRL